MISKDEVELHAMLQRWRATKARVGTIVVFTLRLALAALLIGFAVRFRLTELIGHAK